MQVLDKKRTKEEKEIVLRLKPVAKLQTADDYDRFVDDILCRSYNKHRVSNSHFVIAGEAVLRKRIQELQHYRKMGLRTVADIERYDADVARRVRIFHPLSPISSTKYAFIHRPKQRQQCSPLHMIVSVSATIAAPRAQMLDAQAVLPLLRMQTESRSWRHLFDRVLQGLVPLHPSSADNVSG